MSSGPIILAKFHWKCVVDCYLSTLPKGFLFPVLRYFVDHWQLITLWCRNGEFHVCICYCCRTLREFLLKKKKKKVIELNQGHVTEAEGPY